MLGYRNIDEPSLLPRIKSGRYYIKTNIISLLTRSYAKIFERPFWICESVCLVRRPIRARLTYSTRYMFIKRDAYTLLDTLLITELFDHSITAALCIYSQWRTNMPVNALPAYTMHVILFRTAEIHAEQRTQPYRLPTLVINGHHASTAAYYPIPSGTRHAIKYIKERNK